MEPINDNDSRHLVAKLQSFLEWWAPDWFPPHDDSDRLAVLPPALAWAIRFPPDFFTIGEFIATMDESGELHCLRSYGEQCDGYITSEGDNPEVRFNAGDESFAPTLLNNLVVGIAFQWCIENSDEGVRPNDGINEICTGKNLIWDGMFVDGPLRAWLSGDNLVVQTATHGTTIVRRPGQD